MRIEFRIKVALACALMSGTWISAALLSMSRFSELSEAFLAAQAIDYNAAVQDFARARQNLQYSTTITLGIASGISGLITVWIMRTYERTMTRPILAIQRLANGDAGFRYRRADLDGALRNSHDPIAKLLYEVSRVSTIIERKPEVAASPPRTAAPHKTAKRKDLFGRQDASARNRAEASHPSRPK